jgi:hypothetical protein
MSTQRLLFANHNTVQRLTSGMTPVGVINGRNDVCSDYVLECKHNKVIDKITALMPLKGSAFNGKFGITQEQFAAFRKKVNYIRRKDTLVAILYAFDSCNNWKELDELLSNK